MNDCERLREEEDYVVSDIDSYHSPSAVSRKTVICMMLKTETCYYTG